MKNKQPRTWKLPALEGNEPIEVRAKIPGLKLVRDVRKLGYEATKIEGKKNKIAHEIAKLEEQSYELAKALTLAEATGVESDSIEEIRTKLEGIEKASAQKYDEIEKVSLEVDNNLVAEVKLIAQPTKEETSADDVDWENVDRSMLMEIIDFFVAVSNGTKPAQQG